MKKNNHLPTANYALEMVAGGGDRSVFFSKTAGSVTSQQEGCRLDPWAFLAGFSLGILATSHSSKTCI